MAYHLNSINRKIKHNLDVRSSSLFFFYSFSFLALISINTIPILENFLAFNSLSLIVAIFIPVLLLSSIRVRHKLIYRPAEFIIIIMMLGSIALTSLMHAALYSALFFIFYLLYDSRSYESVINKFFVFFMYAVAIHFIISYPLFLYGQVVGPFYDYHIDNLKFLPSDSNLFVDGDRWKMTIPFYLYFDYFEDRSVFFSDSLMRFSGFSTEPKLYSAIVMPLFFLSLALKRRLLTGLFFVVLLLTSSMYFMLLIFIVPLTSLFVKSGIGQTLFFFAVSFLIIFADYFANGFLMHFPYRGEYISSFLLDSLSILVNSNLVAQSSSTMDYDAPSFFTFAYRFGLFPAACVAYFYYSRFCDFKGNNKPSARNYFLSILFASVILPDPLTPFIFIYFLAIKLVRPSRKLELSPA